MAIPLLSSDMVLYFDSSTMACVKDYSLSVDQNMIEISCMNDTGFIQSYPGKKNATLSFSGVTNRTTSLADTQVDFDGFMGKFLGTNDASTTFDIPPQDVSGNTYVSGYGYISNLSQEGSEDSEVSYSGELKINFLEQLTTDSSIGGEPEIP